MYDADLFFVMIFVINVLVVFRESGIMRIQ